jgi:hypothetical protein
MNTKELNGQGWSKSRLEAMISQAAGPKVMQRIKAWLLLSETEMTMPAYNKIAGDTEESALAHVIRQAWCKDRKQEYVFLPEQIVAVVENVAQKCLHYTNAGSMDDHDAKMSGRVRRTCEDYLWRDDRLPYRRYSTDELEKIAYTVFRDLIAPLCSDEDKEKIAERKRSHKPTFVTKEHPDEELALLIFKEMKEHRLREYTYNQMAVLLSAHWKQVSRIMNGMVVKDHRIYKWTPQGKKDPLFKYAPERKRINECPARTDKIVKETILEYLTEQPERSGNDIEIHMRDYFGHLDIAITRRCLKAMMDVSIDRKKGGRNAWLYFPIW